MGGKFLDGLVDKLASDAKNRRLGINLVNNL